MKREDLERLPRTELVRRALVLGVTRAYEKPAHLLVTDILVKLGENADPDSRLVELASKVEVLANQFTRLEARLGKGLRRVEALAARGLFLAEAAVATRGGARAPTPKEVAALGNDALVLLAAQLGRSKRVSRDRLDLLEFIGEKMGYTHWSQAGFLEAVRLDEESDEEEADDDDEEEGVDDG